MAKFALNINNNEMWLTPAQIDKLLKALAGAVVVETEWKGKDKGFYGTDCQYDAKFLPFEVKRHIPSIKLISQETLDKYLTLQNMRDNDTTN